MGVYVLPKHIVVIYNRYSLVPSKTLNINVKRIYSDREKNHNTDNLSDWFQICEFVFRYSGIFFYSSFGLPARRDEPAQWPVRAPRFPPKRLLSSELVNEDRANVMWQQRVFLHNYADIHIWKLSKKGWLAAPSSETLITQRIDSSLPTR